MRTNVSFTYPADFIPISDEDGVLSIDGAQWFVSLLKRNSGLEVEPELCQEDWGVVIYVQQNSRKFWVGLSMWPDGENAWLAHFHHASFAWLQQFSASSKAELGSLLSSVHEILEDDPKVSNVAWYQEQQMRKANPDVFTTPL